MEEFFKKVRANLDEPYKHVLDDMQITDADNRKEFIDVALMFAENCYGIAKQNGYPVNEELGGEFNWRTKSPARFFKVHFIYFHGEDLIFAIRGFEELTLVEYTANLDSKADNAISIVNPSSTMANNVKNTNLN